MKKKFDCGHTGKGKYCHRCADIERVQLDVQQKKREEQEIAQAKTAERKREREQRRALGSNDVIDLGILDHLPAMQDKAREIIAAMANGQSYFPFGGKRLISMRKEILSIPIGDSFRLIYKVDPYVPVEVISHESYNNKYVT